MCSSVRPGISLPGSSLILTPSSGRAPSHQGEAVVTAEGTAWGGVVSLLFFGSLGGIKVYRGGGCAGDMQWGKDPEVLPHLEHEACSWEHRT